MSFGDQVESSVRRQDYSQISDADWALAERRLGSIERLATAKKITHDLVDQEANTLGVTRARVYEWLRRYRCDPGIDALLPRKRGPQKGGFRLPEHVENIIAQAIEDYYMTAQKPKLNRLVAEIARRCRSAGIFEYPAYRTVKARVENYPRSARVRKRDGKKAANDQFRPVTGDFSADYALEVVQFDHTLVDVIVVDEITRKPIQRPWLTLGVDVASRCVVGYCLTLESPSSLSIALALSHTVLPKTAWLERMGISAPWPVEGTPTTVHLDNAREFHAKALERGCRAHGIELQFRPPRAPHFGGHIERLIGTMMGAVHLLPGTTFSNIQEKGDYASEARAVMTLRELEHWFAIQIVAYNGTLHSQLHLPPIKAYEAALLRRPTALKLPRDEARFLLDFLPFEMRMVRRDGIRLFNIQYWDNVLTAWAGQSKQKMMVKYDPRDLSRVYLCGDDGDYYPISFRDLRRPKITLWEQRHAMARLRECGRQAVDEQMLFDAINAQRLLVDEATAKTKSARRTRQRTAYALAGTETPASMERIENNDPHQMREDVCPGEVSELPFEVEEWA